MFDKPRILVVDDDPFHNELYCQLLRSFDYEVYSVTDAEQVLEIIRQQRFDVVLLDMLLPLYSHASYDFGGIELLWHIKEHDDKIQVIAVTGYGNRELALEATAKGASDYIIKDDDIESRLPGSVYAAIVSAQISRENEQKADDQNNDIVIATPHPFVANSHAMRSMLRRAQSLARIDVPLLIQGEPGVGKELLASVIHFNSRYAYGKLIVAPCANLSPNMVELWGSVEHPKASFCVRAEGGTLVLKDIHKLSFRQQQQLKNLIERRTYFPVHSDEAVNCNVRVIATAHDLAQRVRQGLFWDVLYKALSIGIINVPPLRERRDVHDGRYDDIVSIAGALLHRYRLADGIAQSAAELLMAHDYAQENIDELEETLRIAAEQASRRMIEPVHVQAALLAYRAKLEHSQTRPDPQRFSTSTVVNTPSGSSVADWRAERITPLREEIREKRRRLEKLKILAARQGIQVDPAVTNEIEDIEQDIPALERKLRDLGG